MMAFWDRKMSGGTSWMRLWYFPLLFLWNLHLVRGLNVGDEVWCVTSVSSLT